MHRPIISRLRHGMDGTPFHAVTQSIEIVSKVSRR